MSTWSERRVGGYLPGAQGVEDIGLKGKKRVREERMRSLTGCSIRCMARCYMDGTTKGGKVMTFLCFPRPTAAPEMPAHTSNRRRLLRSMKQHARESAPTMRVGQTSVLNNHKWNGDVRAYRSSWFFYRYKALLMPLRLYAHPLLRVYTAVFISI